jgi:hypothetical protein
MTFARSVGEAFNRGLDDNEVTALFCDTPVRWVGRPSELCIDEDCAGARMHMQPTRIDLDDDSYATVDFLHLRIVKGDLSSWQRVQVG